MLQGRTCSAVRTRTHLPGYNPQTLSSPSLLHRGTLQPAPKSEGEVLRASSGGIAHGLRTYPVDDIVVRAPCAPPNGAQHSELISHAHASLLTGQIPEGVAWNREGLLRHCNSESVRTA